jgi:SAM-dependent methyltransferase
MRKIFITENVQTFVDDAASPLLESKSDIQYFDSVERGIHKVPAERWSLAQRYERKTWMEFSLSAKDDRNHEHFKRFNSLDSIKNELLKINSIIELGCGPFTNLRLLSNMLTKPQQVLLDPLINDYINHEHCPYKLSTLNDNKVALINSSIESFNPSDYNYEIPATYDIVMMINVIEHCYDVSLIFNKVLQILNNDGIFIFADVYFDDVLDIASNIYDAGHPLRLSSTKLDQLLNHFDPIFEQRYHGLFDQEWRNDIYFIGKKRT